MLVVAHLFLSFYAFIAPEGAQAQVKGLSQSEPATSAEALLYRQIGADIFCLATSKDYDFEYTKAISLASSISARLLYQRHGGFVAAAGKKKLTDQQLYVSSQFQILDMSIALCPDSVPEKQKVKVRELRDKMSKKSP